MVPDISIRGQKCLIRGNVGGLSDIYPDYPPRQQVCVCEISAVSLMNEACKLEIEAATTAGHDKFIYNYNAQSSTK